MSGKHLTASKLQWVMTALLKGERANIIHQHIRNTQNFDIITNCCDSQRKVVTRCSSSCIAFLVLLQTFFRKNSCWLFLCSLEVYVSTK